jgi:hypothetical protein
MGRLNGGLSFWLYVRFWPLADIPSCIAHVRFGGQSRHGHRRPTSCPSLRLLWPLVGIFEKDPKAILASKPRRRGPMGTSGNLFRDAFLPIEK